MVYTRKGGIRVQVDIQDRAKEELDRILDAKNVREGALRIHIAGMG